MCALLEILDVLADGKPHVLPESRAGIAVYSGCAEWLSAGDLEEAARNKRTGTRRVRISETGLRERARRIGT